MRITSWNVNGLRAVVSSRRPGGLPQLLDCLGADILCVQETKLTKAELTESCAVLPGWESFFDFCTHKTGYSGVATFCREQLTPRAAWRGVTGGDTASLELAPFTDEERAALDAEGRCIATDHGAFVLFNVYIPALSCEENHEVRYAYKLRVLQVLGARMQRLRQQGRHVAIVGDFNIAPTPLDHCDPSPEFYNRSDRQWMVALLSAPHAWRFPGTSNQGCKFCNMMDAAAGAAQPLCAPGSQSSCEGQGGGAEHSLPCGGFSDTFRWFYAGRAAAFSCWNTATGARSNNWGTRIDLLLVADPAAPSDGGHAGRGATWSWRDAASAADVDADFRGSDHAPAWLEVDLQRMAPIDARPGRTPRLPESSVLLFTGGKQTQLAALWRDGAFQKRGPAAQAKGKPSAPAKQARLTTFLQSSGLKGGSASQAAYAGGQSSARHCAAPCEPASLQMSHREEENSAGPSQRNLTGAGTQEGARFGGVTSRAVLGSGLKADVHVAGQTSGSASSTQDSTQAAPRSALAPTQLQPCPAQSATGGAAGQLAACQPQQPPPQGCAGASQAADPHHSACAGQEEAESAAEARRRAAAQQWQQIKARYQVVKCKGHNEDCVMRQVKKAGPNKGRLFYVCARDDGPPPQGRCDFFQWVKVGQRVIKGAK